MQHAWFSKNLKAGKIQAAKGNPKRKRKVKTYLYKEKGLLN